MTAVWVLLEALRQHEWRAFALAPARAWQGSWQQVTGPGAAGRGQRPLLIVLDCKGGGDARVKAGRTWRLHGAGAPGPWPSRRLSAAAAVRAPAPVAPALSDAGGSAQQRSVR